MTLQTSIQFDTNKGQELAKSFFNTINLSGSELTDAKVQTGLQDKRVLEIFQAYKKMMPVECSKVYDSLFQPAPLTSIRRSITVLTGKGFLRKCDEMGLGRYGKRNFYWEVCLNNISV